MDQIAQMPQIKVEVKITDKSQPLCCPPANMSLWNMHPKVYLELDADKQAMCPYCSTYYVLVEERHEDYAEK